MSKKTIKFQHVTDESIVYEFTASDDNGNSSFEIAHRGKSVDLNAFGFMTQLQWCIEHSEAYKMIK